MNSKNLKQAEKELDSAFTFLGKTVVRSVCTAGDKVRAWAESNENASQSPSQEKDEHSTNVFNDGSWGKVGTQLDSAIRHFGKAVFSEKKNDGTVETEATEKQSSDTDSVNGNV